ncbi:MAG: hypothetical protein HQK60_18235 [Deltaproteobacteria bacterium]|nr:hypothetical protein [Deltaproteobacteria bacterium]
MTAEVGVLNSVGVGLAADSAVTIGQAAEKIYTSAEKLFQLSHVAPVGVMIYGSAFFIGVPWETIIKSYRRRLGDQTFSTVQEYAQDLHEYIQTDTDIFPNERKDEYTVQLVAGFYYFIREALRTHLDEEAEKRHGGIEENELPDIINDFVNRYLAHVREQDALADFSPEMGDSVCDHYQHRITNLKNEIFGNLPLHPVTEQALTDIAVEMLRRKYIGPTKSGVVVAGFGEKQYLPALVTFEVDGVLLGKPRSVQVNNYTIMSEGKAVIIPFAQTDMVYSFMEGIDSRLKEYMTNSTYVLFSGVIEAIVNLVTNRDQALGSEIGSYLGPQAKVLLEKLFGDWSTQSANYWQPVVNVAASLPKDELGAMAEALVNLTKFRRRVTTVPETVAGPIDVAVITKGDGFVWIKRKHYFDPNLNLRLVGRIQRGEY